MEEERLSIQKHALDSEIIRHSEVVVSRRSHSKNETEEELGFAFCTEDLLYLFPRGSHIKASGQPIPWIAIESIQAIHPEVPPEWAVDAGANEEGFVVALLVNLKSCHLFGQGKAVTPKQYTHPVDLERYFQGLSAKVAAPPLKPRAEAIAEASVESQSLESEFEQLDQLDEEQILQLVDRTPSGVWKHRDQEAARNKVDLVPQDVRASARLNTDSYCRVDIFSFGTSGLRLLFAVETARHTAIQKYFTHQGGWRHQLYIKEPSWAVADQFLDTNAARTLCGALKERSTKAGQLRLLEDLTAAATHSVAFKRL